MKRDASALVVLSTVVIAWVGVGDLPAQQPADGYSRYPLFHGNDPRSLDRSGLNAETRPGNAPYTISERGRMEPSGVQAPTGTHSAWGDAVGENPQSYSAQTLPYSRQTQAWSAPRAYTPGPQFGPGPGRRLNGIWRGSGGDILAVYDRTFLWSDLQTKHLAGTLVLTGNQLLAYVAGSEIVMTFQFQQYGDEFQVRDESGQVTVYRRLY